MRLIINIFVDKKNLTYCYYLLFLESLVVLNLDLLITIFQRIDAY